ncbi:MAG: tetratricopeptide repeat protein [Spirochaetales bacterium]
MIRIPIEKLTKETLEKRYYTVRPIYEDILEKFHQTLLPILEPAGVKFTLKKRIKSFESLFSKVLKKARQVRQYSHFEGVEPSVIITDFIGLRIVCPFIEDTIKVEDLLRRNLEVLEQENKGEEYSPHEFGYVSTHIIVKIAGNMIVEGVLQEDVLAEIQIRTILQDAWAEVEHELMYKAEFTPFDEPLRRKLAAVNANLSLSDIIFQEIRDYQRRLQAELKTRRTSFLLKIQSETEENLKNSNARFPGFPPQFQEGQEIQESQEIQRMAKGSPFYETLDNLLLNALTAHNQQQYDKAIDMYSSILARKPKKSIRALVYIHRGMAFFGESKYDKALEDFTAALTLQPENPRIYYYRGIVQRFRKDLNGALLDFNRSLDLDPYHFDSLFSRAQVYFSLGNYVQAMEDCKQALALKPKVAEAQRFLKVIERKISL